MKLRTNHLNPRFTYWVDLQSPTPTDHIVLYLSANGLISQSQRRKAQSWPRVKRIPKESMYAQGQSFMQMEGRGTARVHCREHISWMTRRKNGHAMPGGSPQRVAAYMVLKGDWR